MAEKSSSSSSSDSTSSSSSSSSSSDSDSDSKSETEDSKNPRPRNERSRGPHKKRKEGRRASSKHRQKNRRAPDLRETIERIKETEERLYDVPNNYQRSFKDGGGGKNSNFGPKFNSFAHPHPHSDMGDNGGGSGDSRNSIRFQIQRDKRRNQEEFGRLRLNWEKLQINKRQFANYVEKVQNQMEKKLEHVTKEEKKLSHVVSHCKSLQSHLKAKEIKLRHKCLKYETHVTNLTQLNRQNEEEEERLKKKCCTLAQDELRLQKEKQNLLDLVTKCSASSSGSGALDMQILSTMTAMFDNVKSSHTKELTLGSHSSETIVSLSEPIPIDEIVTSSSTSAPLPVEVNLGQKINLDNDNLTMINAADPQSLELNLKDWGQFEEEKEGSVIVQKYESRTSQVKLPSGLEQLRIIDAALGKLSSSMSQDSDQDSDLSRHYWKGQSHKMMDKDRHKRDKSWEMAPEDTGNAKNIDEHHQWRAYLRFKNRQKGSNSNFNYYSGGLTLRQQRRIAYGRALRDRCRNQRRRDWSRDKDYLD